MTEVELIDSLTLVELFRQNLILNQSKIVVGLQKALGDSQNNISCNVIS